MIIRVCSREFLPWNFREFPAGKNFPFPEFFWNSRFLAINPKNCSQGHNSSRNAIKIIFHFDQKNFDFFQIPGFEKNLFEIIQSFFWNFFIAFFDELRSWEQFSKKKLWKNSRNSRFFPAGNSRISRDSRFWKKPGKLQTLVSCMRVLSTRRLSSSFTLLKKPLNFEHLNF